MYFGKGDDTPSHNTTIEPSDDHLKPKVPMKAKDREEIYRYARTVAGELAKAVRGCPRSDSLIGELNQQLATVGLVLRVKGTS